MEKVIHDINATLTAMGMSGLNAPPVEYVASLYRQALIERQAMPDLPFDWIAYRLVTGRTLDAEVLWWKERSDFVRRSI